MKSDRSNALGSGLALALASGCSLLFSSCNAVHREPPQRVGPPSLVTHENEPRLWLLLRQEESRQRSKQVVSRHSAGNRVSETFYNFELQAHDARTTDRLWKRRLLTVQQKEGGQGGGAAILGQDGSLVWIFVSDQPVAVSSGDGSKKADRTLLEERNPPLRGVLSSEQKFYAFDHGLIVTTADARRFKIRAADFQAEPYQPADEREFARQEFMATQWNGGYRTGDFLVRQAMLGGRWLGHYSEKEAADAGNDTFGRKLENPASVHDDGGRVRRSFWTARIGKTREFTEGAHQRLFDLSKVPNTPDFLAGGMLVKQGTRQAYVPADPTGLLVLHRTRLDTEGRAVLTRLDQDLKEKWSARLPFIELRNRFEFPDRLLMYGQLQLVKKGVHGTQECLASLDLHDGGVKAWNVTLDRSMAGDEMQ